MRLGRIVAGIFFLVGVSLVAVQAEEPRGRVKNSKSASDKPAKAEATAEHSADMAAIRAASQAFVAAFNDHDAKRVALLWTADGEYVDESGHSFAGREAIEKQYGEFFQANPDVRLQVVIDRLRLLSDGAAIEDGRVVLEPAPAGAPAMSKYTAIHVKVDDAWLMSTVRDARVETPSAYRHVADLEWLIGHWAAEEHGVKTESVCQWVANKSFVERKHTTTQPDGTQVTGLQLIGWNPQLGQIQSWNFSSDGGHAIGIWTPRGNGWAAEVHGVLGDGTSTRAFNLLTKQDENAYAWQSIERFVGDQSLPDTDEIIIRRSDAPRDKVSAASKTAK